MKSYVHRLSDPRDPAYPFSDTYICSKCNERLTPEAITCDICNLYIYGEVDTSALNDPSTYPKPSPFNKAYIVDKTNSSLTDTITVEKDEINLEVDDYIKSLFSQSFAIIALLGVILMAFLYFDFTNIVMDFNQQLLGN
ncbi:MAG: hypothetical protein CMG35_01965 [Candidatus Marinimicrobia bacterium]|nr:hypothetical protein [Candidatus Neomarinimicrobiota bacterium]